jgi:hypothetical protein
VTVEINDTKKEFPNVNLQFMTSQTFEVLSYTSAGSPREVELVNKFQCKSFLLNLNDSFIIPKALDTFVNKVSFEANLKTIFNENIKIDSIGEIFSSGKVSIEVYDGKVLIEKDYSLEFDFTGDYILIKVEFDNELVKNLRVRYDYLKNSIILVIEIKGN